MSKDIIDLLNDIERHILKQLKDAAEKGDEGLSNDWAHTYSLFWQGLSHKVNCKLPTQVNTTGAKDSPLGSFFEDANE